MKAKASTIILTLCLTSLISQNAFPQASHPEDRVIAGQSPVETRVRVDSQTTGSDPLESLIRRDGLQFYVEVRSGGLAQLAQAAPSLRPIARLFLPDSTAANAELPAFLMKNLAMLSGSRVALAGYGSGGTVVLVEAPSPAEAERLKEDLVRLTASSGARGPAEGAPFAVVLKGRTVFAGAQPAVSMLTGPDRGLTLADDHDFVAARSRFATDPFFAFVEVGAAMRWDGRQGADKSAAYMAGVMAALNSMPSAVAIGGSIQGDATSLRALLLYGPDHKGGLFSSIMSSANNGQPVAAKFASADTDLFIDVMLDWDKLYEGMETLFGTIAHAGAPSQGDRPQGVDVFAMLEASLGFSIKNDLIPTLGSELAFSVDGIERFIPRGLGPQPARQSGAVRKAPVRSTTQGSVRSPSVRFLLIIALRDSAKFEKLIAQLLAKASPGPSPSFAHTPYRGATINYKSSIAYTVSGGFFILGGGVGEVKRALDAHALGGSLASSAGFQTAMGAPRPVMMQAYVSGALSGRIFEAIAGLAVKSTPELSALAGPGAMRAPLGLVVTRESEGVMIETRIPTGLALAALASLVNRKPAVHGSGSGVESGPAIGIPGGYGVRAPRLTTDDVRIGKP